MSILTFNYFVAIDADWAPLANDLLLAVDA